MNHSLMLRNWRVGSLLQNVLKRRTSKIGVQIDENLLDKLNNNEVKPRKHPGVAKKQSLALPEHISRALKRVIGDRPVKALLQDAQKLNQYIAARHPPTERKELRHRTQKIVEEVDTQMPPPTNFAELSEEEQSQWRYKRDKAIQRLLGQRSYAWKPIAYGNYEALVYAVGRGAQEFGVLKHILQEVVARDANFKPSSYFDFGSGVGSGMWAVSDLWRDNIYEYYNVDACREMHDISELILRDGNDNQQMTLRNVYYRQFLPALDTKYDLVVSAYTLFELAGAQQRRETLLNLWRKCDKYMILVEEGTRRGFELINEARGYILGQGEVDAKLKGHVFAPCPQDLPCPRLSNTLDNTPCNFQLAYKPLDVGDAKFDHLSTRYSYVVLKKGKVTDETRDWPRLVRPTLSRSKHVICRMCTADARLQEVIFTQSKHGRVAYRCAKASRWGDRLPMEVGKPFAEMEAQNETQDEEKPSPQT